MPIVTKFEGILKRERLKWYEYYSGIMKKIENGVFPGRFQPMTLGHLAIVKKIVEEHQPARLVVAIPKQKETNRDNPFSAEQSVRIARVSLDEAGLGEVETELVDMTDGLVRAWTRELRTHKIDAVFTGNQRMSVLVNTLAAGLGVKTRAICFGDGSIGNIRATDVRAGLAEQNDCWKNMVMPEAARYIDTLDINFNEIPESRCKRFWQVK